MSDIAPTDSTSAIMEDTRRTTHGFGCSPMRRISARSRITMAYFTCGAANTFAGMMAFVFSLKQTYQKSRSGLLEFLKDRLHLRCWHLPFSGQATR